MINYSVYIMLKLNTGGIEHHHVLVVGVTIILYCYSNLYLACIESSTIFISITCTIILTI